MTVTRPLADAQTAGGIDRLIQSWKLHLDAANLSDATQRNYLAAVKGLATFLDSSGMPKRVADITTEHLRMFLIHVRDQAVARGRTDGSSTANTRRAALLQFFRYLISGGHRHRFVMPLYV